MTIPPGPPPHDRSGLFHGMQFGVYVALGLGAGLWVDRRWSTEPWGVVLGFLGGAVLGFYHLIRSDH